ncbi:FAD dependent oxidoreductase [Microdochium trichocladiopsis]|uniref:FAD dependent oxidoreductase n=1 Tax=Microdochium trichocladiopsis TaxID=1682393 RepID=A0A9P8Y9I9_9PEZI|nr:FAD dependent oxidoreductase [Microdochium trichocladiopsis]KAH7033186.1 FAD dependent oxidoreductase [Microdochium trichocladiopsis]
MEPRPRHIIIVGGGIIGTTTAYYLTRHPSWNPSIHHVTLLEATAVASGASGKAGGLLGLWAYPQCIVDLSYRLHADLAAEHGGAERWGYRRVTCGQISAKLKRDQLRRRTDTAIGAGAGVGTPESKHRQPRRKSNVTPSAKQPLLTPKHGPIPTLTPSSSDNSDGSLDRCLDLKMLQSEEENRKEWHRLPKQDAAAAELLRESVLPPDLDWIDHKVVLEYAEMGMPGYTETAQVHPYKFTTAIAELAQQAGVQVRNNAKVTRIGLNAAKTAISNVEYLDRITNETRTLLGVTDVIVAAGPWTSSLVPQVKIDPLRVHSVVYSADVTPFAVFTNISLPGDWVPAHRAAKGQKRIHKGRVDPEFYARPDGEVYACGEPDYDEQLPETADLVPCDDLQCDDMISYIATVSPVLARAPIAAKQACYIPQHVCADEEGGPLVGATSVKGLWVAAGHTCWGIQNGPGTGKLMSELIFDGEAKSADITSLDPRQCKGMIAV